MSNALSQHTQKLKLLLIPALALVLGAVLLWPSVDEAAEEPLTTLVRPTAGDILAVDGPPNAQLWKGMDLSQVSQINPFASLQAPKSEAADDTQQANASADGQASDSQLANRRVTRSVLAVIHRNGKAYACIDDEVAAIGDTLADGTRVVAITADAVVVETTP